MFSSPWYRSQCVNNSASTCFAYAPRGHSLAQAPVFLDNCSMLIPQFSLRTTLQVLTVCAVLFLVAGQALAGKAWAVIVTVAVLSVLATLLVHGCFYLVAAALSKLTGTQQTPARTSQGGLQLSPDLQELPPRQASHEESAE